MRIGEVAKQLCISAAWLRELERAGRVPKALRDVNGHRRYTPDDARRLKVFLFRPPATRRASSATQEKAASGGEAVVR